MIFIIAFLGVIISILSYLDFKLKDLFIMICGIISIIITCTIAYNDNESSEKSILTTGTLNTKIDSLNKTIENQVELLKSIGIKIDTKTNVISVVDSQILRKVLLIDSSKSETSKPVQQPELSLSNNSDSLGLVLEKGKDDTIYIYSANAIWSLPYVGFDSKYESNKENIPFGVESYGANPETVTIKEKSYQMVLWRIYVPPTKANPFYLNSRLYKNQVIIFGDQSVRSKRYAYKNGALTWAPEK